LIDLIPAAEQQAYEASRTIAVGSRRDGQALTPVLKVRGLIHEYRSSHGPRRKLGLFGRRRLEDPSQDVFRAVDDLSFDVAQGECVGLVGESGSGKTTTSRLIAKLVKPTAGSIQLSGNEIADTDPRAFARTAHRRLVQIVFQDPAASLDPRRTAFEAIADPLRRMTQINRPDALGSRIREICDLVGLPQVLLHRYPHQLSGGQKARVGIARAISVNPALIVLDEPTSALDVSVQAVVLNQLDQLKRVLGLSYLFVSHDLNVVRLMCDRVMVMKSGRIVEQGQVGDMFDNPQHPYTRSLLAAIPRINIGMDGEGPTARLLSKFT
jgi:peptide/nickel transport system ATP-binding protein